MSRYPPNGKTIRCEVCGRWVRRENDKPIKHTNMIDGKRVECIGGK